ncbi:hypothetical protein [Sphingomonas sp. SUN039]|uniref:hypothetical protein n=1 Tax=Sphingomonas sp. SUN039 TaxID=2937787 RepID=UPI002164EAD1|nr:hypothetical protein [Sphingomonas sp. SUN039]UVO55782.1 hypothetical protein M0209_17305 [Sphingomonas sp. SUN039]
MAVARESTIATLAAEQLLANETPESMSGLTVAQLVDRFRAQWLQADGLRARLSVIGSLLDYSPTAARLAVPDWAVRAHMLVWLPWRLLKRRWRYPSSRPGNAASKP